jgi:recombination protein RecA
MIGDDVKRFLARAKGAALDARVVPLDEIHRNEAPVELWGLAALRGRLVEISARGASATLTTAIDLVLEAQSATEPVAWVTLAAASFYPPDVADSGVDLAALVVVRVASSIVLRTASGAGVRPAPAGPATAAARAAERLLRSGAFGLVVIDLGSSGSSEEATFSSAVQGRLVTLAQAHDAAIVCLTTKTDDSSSLGSLVSLRTAAIRTREPLGVTVRALKDKRRGPGWMRTLKVRGPPGFG